MSSVGKIRQLVGNKHLSFYQLEAVRCSGESFPYYMASRTQAADRLNISTGDCLPDGVILYGVYGEQRDRVVLIRQYRFPGGGYVYEFPAGLVEPGEDLLQSGIREMFEETGLTFTPVEAGSRSKPFFMSVGMTDECCGTVFGYCEGIPTNCHQEDSEEIQVVIADRAECRRILREEHVALPCAYMLMHFIASSGDPLDFLKISDMEI